MPTPAFGGTCSTGSFLVAGPGVFRCVQESFIYDPCYLDTAAGNAARSVVVCVETPWSPNVLRLRVTGPLDPRYGAAPTTRRGRCGSRRAGAACSSAAPHRSPTGGG